MRVIPQKGQICIHDFIPARILQIYIMETNLGTCDSPNRTKA